MSALQLGFIAFTFCAPPLLWALSRRVRSPRLARAICLTFAGILLLAYVAAVVIRATSFEGLTWDSTLPMQLCDWAAFVTLLALIGSSPAAFELAYCWGLAGTAQALFTPAIEVNDSPGVIPFFVVHSVIPASVLWLMFEFRMRPRPGAFWRVMLWSEAYLGVAILVNKLTGGNYGFLAERPPTRSLLDFYSETKWIYVAQINLTAAVLFGLLLMPWVLRDRVRALRGSSTSV
jgi:hypothetical integral membrane protein (TIGR02206 family)